MGRKLTEQQQKIKTELAYRRARAEENITEAKEKIPELVNEVRNYPALMCDGCREVFVIRTMITPEELVLAAILVGWRRNNFYEVMCPRCGHS